jgi:hypothetical protein
MASLDDPFEEKKCRKVETVIHHGDSKLLVKHCNNIPGIEERCANFFNNGAGGVVCVFSKDTKPAAIIKLAEDMIGKCQYCSKKRSASTGPAKESVSVSKRQKQGSKSEVTGSKSEVTPSTPKNPNKTSTGSEKKQAKTPQELRELLNEWVDIIRLYSQVEDLNIENANKCIRTAADQIQIFGAHQELQPRDPIPTQNSFSLEFYLERLKEAESAQTSLEGRGKDYLLRQLGESCALIAYKLQKRQGGFPGTEGFENVVSYVKRSLDCWTKCEVDYDDAKYPSIAYKALLKLKIAVEDYVVTSQISQFQLDGGSMFKALMSLLLTNGDDTKSMTVLSRVKHALTLIGPNRVPWSKLRHLEFMGCFEPGTRTTILASLQPNPFCWLFNSILPKKGPCNIPRQASRNQDVVGICNNTGVTVYVNGPSKSTVDDQGRPENWQIALQLPKSTINLFHLVQGKNELRIVCRKREDLQTVLFTTFYSCEIKGDIPQLKISLSVLKELYKLGHLKLHAFRELVNRWLDKVLLTNTTYNSYLKNQPGHSHGDTVMSYLINYCRGLPTEAIPRNLLTTVVWSCSEYLGNSMAVGQLDAFFSSRDLYLKKFRAKLNNTPNYRLEK